MHQKLHVQTKQIQFWEWNESCCRRYDTQIHYIVCPLCQMGFKHTRTVQIEFFFSIMPLLNIPLLYLYCIVNYWLIIAVIQMRITVLYCVSTVTRPHCYCRNYNIISCWTCLIWHHSNMLHLYGKTVNYCCYITVLCCAIITVITCNLPLLLYHYCISVDSKVL